jgi:hypothetical protein
MRHLGQFLTIATLLAVPLAQPSAAATSVETALAETALAETALVQATKSSEKYQHPYPSDMVEAYTKTCSNAGGKRIPRSVMSAICTCTIEEFQNTFSLKEFTAIGDSIEKGKGVPPEMTKIMEDCVEQVINRPNV